MKEAKNVNRKNKVFNYSCAKKLQKTTKKHFLMPQLSPVKILEELLHPLVHYLVVRPSPHKLFQKKLPMLVAERIDYRARQILPHHRKNIGYKQGQYTDGREYKGHHG